MISSWSKASIQTRLAIAIPALTVVILGLSFFAVYRGVTAELQSGIEQTLDEEVRHYGNAVVEKLTAESQLEPASKLFVFRQGFDPSSPILAIELRSGNQITNQEEILRRELREEVREGERAPNGRIGASALLNAQPGLSTVSIEDVGSLRVVSEPIFLDGGRIGTFRAALSLDPVKEAQAGLERTFLIVGLLALVASIALAIWIASILTRPLREMADTAAEIGGGDLTKRVSVVEGGEVGILAQSFNQMLDRLQAAFDRERDFVSDASHELRTPLTVLRGQIELLEREGASSKEVGERSGVLLGEISRMNHLVDDMLLLARAESGGMLQKQQISLDPFLEDLERDLPMLGSEAIEVVGRPGGVLDADPDRLEQILRNLVRNAIKYGREPIRITVEGKGRRLIFSVSDSGDGVDEAQLPYLFDRFYRGDQSRNRSAGGSGLGLAITKALVEAHGGKVEAISRPGEGLTVEFSIPGWKAPAGRAGKRGGAAQVS
jgi:two-component system OmpR family sensor kinase